MSIQTVVLPRIAGPIGPRQQGGCTGGCYGWSVAKHAYRLVYIPQYFADTYVLVTDQGGSYAVRDYSQDREKRYGPKKFDHASLRELLGGAEDKRHAEPHRTDDVAHWSLLIRRTNRRIGREGGLDLR